MAYIYNDEDNAPINDDKYRLERNCKACKHHDGTYCTTWDCNFIPKDGQVKADKNCHERCRYSEVCWKTFKCKGSNQADFPDECALYYKIDDLMQEARDIPFFDPDDIPEEEEALDDD